MSSTPIPGSHLADLLACERELASLHAEAEAEAKRRVDAAHGEARGREAELEARLEGESEALRATIRDATRARVEAVASDAADRARLYDELPDARVEALAESARRWLLVAGVTA